MRILLTVNLPAKVPSGINFLAQVRGYMVGARNLLLQMVFAFVMSPRYRYPGARMSIRTKFVLAERKPVANTSAPSLQERQLYFSKSDIENRILYKSDHFIVFDKPYDVRMTGDFESTVPKLLEVAYPDIGLKPVHQLDHATSGTLCYGLSRRASALVCSAFRNREVFKSYLAIVEGTLLPSEWPEKQQALALHREAQREAELIRQHIQEVYSKSNMRTDIREKAIWLNLGKSKYTTSCVYQLPRQQHISDSSKMLVIESPIAAVEDDFRMEIGTFSPSGKAAKTTIEVVGHGFHKGSPITKVLLYPHSGRRHQLRLHCLAIGHPILGDFTYNMSNFFETEDDFATYLQNPIERERPTGRMMLHAYSLKVKLPQFHENSREDRKIIYKDLKSGNSVTVSKGAANFRPSLVDQLGSSPTDCFLAVSSDDPFRFVQTDGGPELAY